MKHQVESGGLFDVEASLLGFAISVLGCKTGKYHMPLIWGELRCIVISFWGKNVFFVECMGYITGY
jgi:hypothetical protein